MAGTSAMKKVDQPAVATVAKLAVSLARPSVADLAAHWERHLADNLAASTVGALAAMSVDPSVDGLADDLVERMAGDWAVLWGG